MRFERYEFSILCENIAEQNESDVFCFWITICLAELDGNQCFISFKYSKTRRRSRLQYLSDLERSWIVHKRSRNWKIHSARDAVGLCRAHCFTWLKAAIQISRIFELNIDCDCMVRIIDYFPIIEKVEVGILLAIGAQRSGTIKYNERGTGTESALSLTWERESLLCRFSQGLSVPVRAFCVASYFRLVKQETLKWFGSKVVDDFCNRDKTYCFLKRYLEEVSPCCSNLSSNFEVSHCRSYLIHPSFYMVLD